MRERKKSIIHCFYMCVALHEWVDIVADVVLLGEENVCEIAVCEREENIP